MTDWSEVTWEELAGRVRYLQLERDGQDCGWVEVKPEPPHEHINWHSVEVEVCVGDAGREIFVHGRDRKDGLEEALERGLELGQECEHLAELLENAERLEREVQGRIWKGSPG